MEEGRCVSLTPTNKQTPRWETEEQEEITGPVTDYCQRKGVDEEKGVERVQQKEVKFVETITHNGTINIGMSLLAKVRGTVIKKDGV